MDNRNSVSKCRLSVCDLGVAACAFAAATLVAVAALLGGCAADTSQEPASAEDRGRAMSQQVLPEESVGNVGQAMVIIAGDRPLFVDTSTKTPYYPTIPDGALSDERGAAIAPAQLEVGNVVEVTGDGIMLESYPGQYPGITAVRVLEKGSAADAAQYQDLIDQLTVSVDTSAVPLASLSYSTDLANTTLLLEPAAYAWQPDGGEAQNKELDVLEDNGEVAGTANDARVSAAVDAALLFDVAPTGVAVTRMPLVCSGDNGAVDPSSSEEAVQVVLEGPEARFSMAPDNLYTITATYDSGQVVYAFVALPPRQ